MNRLLIVTRKLTLLCAAMVLGGVATATFANETKSGGDWFDDATWVEGIPSGSDSATISAGHTVTVTKPGAGANILNVDGTLSVTADNPLSPPGLVSVGTQMAIGYSAFGQVKLSSGGRANTSNVLVGATSLGTGSVAIDGAPSFLGARSSWTNTGQFVIGGAGFGLSSGAVSLTNGAEVTTANTGVARGLSTGLLDINDSRWTNTNLFTVGDGGKEGSLNLTNHGVVNTLTGAIGYGSGSSGSLRDTVGKAFIDNATWNNKGDFYVGTYAVGQLNAIHGAAVASTTGYIGYGEGSTGTATFENSTWTTTGALFVGLYGDGRLNVNHGAVVTSAQGVLGRYGQSQGAAYIDGGTWNNAGDLYVAHGVTGLPGTNPKALLSVVNGGTVMNLNGFIGYGPSHGEVVVKGVDASGKASTWTMAGELHVGQSGQGTLTIDNRGLVVSGTTYLGPAVVNPTGGGAINLQGTTGARGTLQTAQIFGGQGLLTFDGGVVRATMDQSDFMHGVTGTVVATNGMFVDTNGHAVGIDTQLTGPGGLTKLGAGTLSLSGLAYLGSMSTVEAGKLAVNGFFNGDIQVNAGAVLGGSGQVTGAVNVLPGGILSPGNSPGTLTMGSLTLGHDSHLLIELGPISDHLVINGNVTLDGFVDFAGDPSFFALGGFPDFITYTGALTNNGIQIGLLPEGVNRDGLVFDFSTPGLIRLSEGVAITPVPEPSTLALMLLGLGGLLSRTKLRRVRPFSLQHPD
jgi:T5SS/PEP-CTERM-associated repeat protein